MRIYFSWISLILIAILAVLALFEIFPLKRNSYSTDETVYMRVRRVLICVLLAICALCPCIMKSTFQRSLNATNVIFVLDVTGSMNVNDSKDLNNNRTTRFNSAKQIIKQVTNNYANASFSAIRFGASSSVDVPLTPDANAIENWVNTINTEPVGVSNGTSLDAPLDKTLLAAQAIHDAHPQDVTVLYLISDGEETTSRKRRTFSSLRGYINHAYVIGVGSKNGGKIPNKSTKLDNLDDINVTDSSIKQSEKWVIDPSTKKPGISKMDSKNLKNIADELSGKYIDSSKDHSIGVEAKQILSKQWRQNNTVKPRLRPEPIVWPFAILASVLILWELACWITKSRKLI